MSSLRQVSEIYNLFMHLFLFIPYIKYKPQIITFLTSPTLLNVQIFQKTVVDPELLLLLKEMCFIPSVYMVLLKVINNISCIRAVRKFLASRQTSPYCDGK